MGYAEPKRANAELTETTDPKGAHCGGEQAGKGSNILSFYRRTTNRPIRPHSQIGQIGNIERIDKIDQ